MLLASSSLWRAACSLQTYEIVENMRHEETF